MTNYKWLEVEMTLQGTPNKVFRKVVIPDYFTMYYLHIIVASMFNFDDLLDVRFSNEDLDIFISESNEGNVEDMFVELRDVLAASDNHEFLYTYYGQDDWQVVLNFKEVARSFEHIKCIEATGNAILFAQMTHELYEKIYTFTQENAGYPELVEKLVGEDSSFLNNNLEEIDLQALNHKLLLLEPNFIDDEASLYDDNDLSGFDDEESIEDFDTNGFLMYLYHEVAGFNEDQAAYEILYKTTITDIVDAMIEAGYEEEVIDKMLSTEIPFDENIYEQISDQVDLLTILPKRKEIFSEEEENFLVKIEEIMLQHLEKYDVDLLELEDIEEDIEQKVNDAIIKDIEKLRMQKLS